MPGLISWPPGFIFSPPVSTLPPQQFFPRVNMTSPPSVPLKALQGIPVPTGSSASSSDQHTNLHPTVHCPPPLSPSLQLLSLAKFFHSECNIPFLTSLPPCLYCSLYPKCPFLSTCTHFLPNGNVSNASYSPFPPQVKLIPLSVN